MSNPNMFDDSLIEFNLGISLDLATDCKIYYKKPDGTRGSWAASVSGQSIVYNATNGELDQPGHWEFQAKFLLDGARKSSDISTSLVEKPLGV